MTEQFIGDVTPDELCARMAADRHGVISLAQAHAAGLSKQAISYRISRGRMARELPGALSMSGAPTSWERDLTAAIFWAGDGSAASHRAAARRWAFDGFASAPIEISTVNHKHRHELRLSNGSPVVVHRADAHIRPEIVTIGNDLVTSVRRTILDLAGTRHRRTESALDEALRRKLTDLGRLWFLLEQEWMRGRRGVRILRNLLMERTEGRAPSQSRLESMMRKLIDRAGLPDPAHQFPVRLPSGLIHVDLAYPEAMLAIEVDGYIWHMDREAFERDRERDNELRALGWTVFRFTWSMIRFDAPRVADLIRRHLDRTLTDWALSPNY